MIGCELINPGLGRIDVRGDWRLSHLGDTSSPYLSQLHPPPFILFLAFTLFFPPSSFLFISSRSAVPRFDSPGAGREVGGPRGYHQHQLLCLLDLLILLHLNFINCSTGPEAEKNENSLCGNSFFSLAPLLLFDLI